ncbi:MAG TPA: hypothetical protein VET48_02765, partial [Steroidobacteraceae bacterium]|nr:hypothetical protein [Steroidobacteraceae bacterium]
NADWTFFAAAPCNNLRRTHLACTLTTKVQRVNKVIEFLLIVAVGTALVFVIAFLIRRSMRNVKKQPPGMAAFYWALLFFSSGRMPPPPPQEYSEQEQKQKKNKEAGRMTHGDR